MAHKRGFKIIPKFFKRSSSSKFAKKILEQSLIRKIVIGFCLFVLALAVVFFSFNLAYQDKVFPRTFIGKTNFGGMTKSEARQTLLQLIDSSKDGQLNFSWDSNTYVTSLPTLEVNYKGKQDQTLDGLFAIGRQGSLGKVLFDGLRSVFAKNAVKADFGFNQIKVNEYLMNIAQEQDKIEKDATIEIKDGQPVVIPEEIGQKFAFDENYQILLASIGSFNFDNLPLKIDKVYPKIDSQIAGEAIPEVQNLISHQITLKAGDKSFEISPQEVADMIEFVARLGKQDINGKNAKSLATAYSLQVEISPAKTAELVEKIASDVYQEPRDPKFQVASGRVVAFQLAQTGYELEKEKSVSQIIVALKEGQKELELPVKITESSISSNNPTEIGLKEVIGEGTTNFSGSPSNRRHNISVGADQFDGVLVKPGEEFSMIKYLGAVDALTGYLPELVIKEDRTIPEYGGGLCQVSTTMFRAALNSGLKITERQNHSYRVRYYEPPVGMDATIYIPRPDFRFVNDFSSHILIQTSISGNNLTFTIYGTRDGRKVEITDPYVYDVTGAGEAIYTESADLAPGEIKKIESAHPGSKASFTYKVYNSNNEILHDDTFTSSYAPWPARYFYGPGTTIPPAEPAE